MVNQIPGIVLIGSTSVACILGTWMPLLACAVFEILWLIGLQWRDRRLLRIQEQQLANTKSIRASKANLKSWERMYVALGKPTHIYMDIILLTQFYAISQIPALASSANEAIPYANSVLRLYIAQKNSDLGVSSEIEKLKNYKACSDALLTGLATYLNSQTNPSFQQQVVNEEIRALIMTALRRLAEYTE